MNEERFNQLDKEIAVLTKSVEMLQHNEVNLDKKIDDLALSVRDRFIELRHAMTTASSESEKRHEKWRDELRQEIREMEVRIISNLHRGVGITVSVIGTLFGIVAFMWRHLSV